MLPSALRGHRALRRSLAIWATVAYIAASVGLAVLISDAVHDVSQSMLRADGLDPPIPGVVGVVAFLISACISIALAVRCSRLRRHAIARLAARSLRAWELRFTLTAAAALIGAIITAVID